MSLTPQLVCQVCHQPIGANDQYLVRIGGKATTAVHRSLCFPPARAGATKQTAPARRAA